MPANNLGWGRRCAMRLPNPMPNNMTARISASTYSVRSIARLNSRIHDISSTMLATPIPPYGTSTARDKRAAGAPAPPPEPAAGA